MVDNVGCVMGIKHCFGTKKVQFVSFVVLTGNPGLGAEVEHTFTYRGSGEELERMGEKGLCEKDGKTMGVRHANTPSQFLHWDVRVQGRIRHEPGLCSTYEIIGDLRACL